MRKEQGAAAAAAPSASPALLGTLRGPTATAGIFSGPIESARFLEKAASAQFMPESEFETADWLRSNTSPGLKSLSGTR